MIALSVRVAQHTSSWPSIAQEQIPFGTSVGINKTLYDIRNTQRRGIEQRFTVRRASFMRKVVDVPQEGRSDKRRLRGWVHVGLGEPETLRRGSKKYTRHEAGGVISGTQWIPTKTLRPNMADMVRPSLRPWALGLHQTVAQMAAGTMAFRGTGQISEFRGDRRGNRRAFLLMRPNRSGLIGIFQRTGRRKPKRRKRSGGARRAPGTRQQKPLHRTRLPGQRTLDPNIRFLWRYRPSITLKPRLGFVQTARIVVRSRLAANIEDGLVKALRTARPRTQSR